MASAAKKVEAAKQEIAAHQKDPNHPNSVRAQNQLSEALAKWPSDEELRKLPGLENNLSGRIRHLKGMGCPTADIARIVKRENGEHPKYQHVRNVLNQQLNKGSNAVATNDKGQPAPVEQAA